MAHSEKKVIVAPFCRQSWYAPAIILILLVLGTFAWGIHLVKDHREELRALADLAQMDAAESPLMVSALPAAAEFDPVSTMVRASLVNVAGIMNNQGAGEKFVSVGSGVVVAADGHLITANHLLTGLKEIFIRVQTPAGPRQYSGRLVKAVKQHDLALIKIVSKDVFPYLIPGDSRLLAPGTPVEAWGDPDGSATLRNMGTIDGGLSREPVRVGTVELTHLLAASAVNHWAMVGGPLVDGKGRLLGINLLIQAPGNRLIGYSIPSHVIVTHFQDVVDFPMIGMVNQPPGGGTTPQAVPAAMTIQQHPPAGIERPPRQADHWWQRAKAMVESQLGYQLPSFRGMPDINAGGGQSHATTPRILGFPIPTFLGLLLLGFFSGLCGGMMTMGGGIIKVIGLMSVFGYGLLLVRPVAYITNIFMYGAASLRYRRGHLYRWSDIQPMIPWAMVGVVMGYFVGNVLNSGVIRILLGIFALFLAIKMLVEISEEQIRSGILGDLQRALGAKEPDGSYPASLVGHSTLAHGLLGLPMGVISGILGITGGVIEVPLQRYILQAPLRRAIANSAVLVFFASIVGSLVAVSHGVQTGAFTFATPMILALILTPGAYLGGLVGAWLTTVAPLNVLRWMYALLMTVISFRMILS
ncbi:MAG: TSUP family transporter [Magnetococcales bacterium]|nr:TSUP family transporter [Magnetococcales bacterium]